MATPRRQAPSLWRNLPFLIRRTVLSAADDGCFTVAKGAAYSSLLSFFPVLTSAAALLAETRAEFVAHEIAAFIPQFLPPGTEQAVAEYFRNLGNKPVGLLVFANLLSLYAASSVIRSLIEGFHAAYRVPKVRGWFHETILAMLLVFGAAVPLVAASALLLFGKELEGQVLQIFQVDPLLNPVAMLWEFLWRVTRYAVAVLATVSLTSILYYFGPYRKQRFTRVIPGAVVATILWAVATSGFGWYVRNVSNYNVLYGSIGTGIALLVWMYLLCAIAILGCEFNAEYERMLALK